ncbi:Protein CBG15911 [Caenorhabditis briggsae]|uniref:Protein CBG15911 n=1 Tax=Caenorhabditis briggsae TaxID=6238 RepID=A8XN21_CAEBR|nr:Protein CBG15911 [Caenorhabditis briggsae]CAP34047.1 Protein CBG15911 [Caenorhabditis briggsae]
MHSVVEINDPKRRNEIVNNFLKNRKEHKIKNLQERSDLEHVEDYRIEVFKPILESNKKLQEEIIDEKNKIVETLNNFKSPSQLSIAPATTPTPKTNRKSLIKQPSVILPPSLPSSSSPQVVSNLIVSYLQDNSDRSNAGYSIKFNKAEKKYAIGNKDITFDQNIIKVNNEEYTATEGLMELLLKKSPDLNKVTTEDSSNYKKILLCSNALYQGFDKNSKRYNADSSDKWAFIKSKYFVAKTPTTAGTSSTSGSSISFIPSNTNSLIDSLRLSIGSYQAGNKDEYNKIHAMLDELVKQKVIKKKDLGVIYLNIGM